jgi:DnaK suppressor protein
MAAKKGSARTVTGRRKPKKASASNPRTAAGVGKGATAGRKTAKKAAKKAAAKPAKRVAAPARSGRKSPAAAAKTEKPGKAVAGASRFPAASSRRADLKPVRSSVGLIHGIPPYQPKGGETYMSDRQLQHFRQILLAWKRELMEEVDRTVHHMQDEASNFPDPNDRATQESEFGLELRTRDRERKLLKKIDSALERIDEGSYGYCEETGEEIGLRRLEARPVATLSVEAQERRELAERQFRDREDGY